MKHLKQEEKIRKEGLKGQERGDMNEEGKRRKIQYRIDKSVIQSLTAFTKLWTHDYQFLML